MSRPLKAKKPGKTGRSAKEIGCEIGKLSVSVRKGATFSVQLGPPQWLRVESFEEA
jgi:hypothetical protein